MKTERKTAALRRGIAFLCTLVLTLMAVTLPAEAAPISGLTDSNIGLNEGTYDEGSKPFSAYKPKVTDESYFWKATDGTTIEGTLKPKEIYGWKTTWSYSGNRYQCYKGASTVLTITNKSNEECLLTFSYEDPKNGGTLSFNPASIVVGSGSYSAKLKRGASVAITLTTAKETADSTKPTQDLYTATTTLRNISMKPLDQTVSVEFVKPTNGSYTAKIGNESLTIPQTCTKPVSTTYTLQATADKGYFFDGWYVNNVLTSREPTFPTAFAANSRVEARFVNDPLLYITKMSEPTLIKSNYVEIDSDHIHSEKQSYHTNVGDTDKNNSYSPSTSFPDSRWAINDSGGITSSTDYTKYGAATGDNQTQPGYSQATALLYSDVIRVKCLENCTISFDSSITAQNLKIRNSGSSDDQYGVFLYYYTSSSPNVSVGTIKANGTAAIKGSQASSGSANGTQVTLNKNEYLYLCAYAWMRYDELFLGFTSITSGYAENKYSYSASISNVTVTPSNENYSFKTQNTDNMDNALAGGTVLINGTHQSVSKPYTPELAKGTVLTLKPGTAPKGYTFIGWHNVTTGEHDYTHDTYTVTMTQPWEVNPIYVPAMTITTGGDNGYENATYEYKNLNNQTKPTDGLYVARGPIPSNGENPTFYTSLKDAFAATDNTVFLLAGDIITGDLTIPAGKTLVIPDRFAAKGPDLQTGLPEQYDPSASISSYCKVSYSGKLTVYGTLVVNARQSGAAGGVCGRATGGIGYLSLADSATVTVKSGGRLFGYGLIRGGSISAESGSTVRELMEISDMRAALVMKEIYDGRNNYKVFPFSNFSIKSIESRTTYQTGANLYAQYSVKMEGNNKSTGAAPLFAKTGALFNLTEGTMTKYFDPTTYKTVYRVDENSAMSTGFFQLDVRFEAGGQTKDITIDTKEYWVPLNAGFDLRTAGDMTVNGDFKFLPGASLSVEKGGKCTVVNGKSLLFYRLNDYDTRGIVQGIYQKGYSSKPYPVNAVPLPEGNYTLPKPETVGSARLNVDGEMIVKGGLYVSNELVRDSDQGYKEMESGKTRQEINADYFTLYPNGYNVLTGTGSIDMTAAQTDQEKVYEAMTSTNTNKPAWAPIKITPIKGLTMEATKDDPENYQPLKPATTYYGVYRSDGFYVWTDTMPQIAKIVNGANEQTYSSLANAVQAYTGEGYIQMLDKSTEPGFTVDRNVTLDLNGKTVTLVGGLTVEEGKTLSGMDISSKEYVAPSGKIVGKVTGTVAPTYQTPTVTTSDGNTYDRYVAIPGTEADGNTPNLSFHHFNISVTGYHFELATGDTPQCALFFIGKFRGDDAAKKYLTKLGFTLKYIADESQDFSYPMPGSLNNEVGLDEEGAYLFEAYLMRSFDKNDAAAYQTKISATAQAIFGTNVGTQNSETKEWSFEDAWTESEGLKDLTPEQKAILDKFLKELGITKQAE